MFKFFSNILAAQRNARALDYLEFKTSAIVRHATEGAIPWTGHKLPLDTILKAIHSHFSRLETAAFSEGAEHKEKALAGDILHSMHEAERKVLVGLDDEVGHKLGDIAAESGLALNDVRTLAKGLAIKGLAYYGPLVDLEHGTPKGSGYLLTGEGARLKARARDLKVFERIGSKLKPSTAKVAA